MHKYFTFRLATVQTLLIVVKGSSGVCVMPNKVCTHGQRPSQLPPVMRHKLLVCRCRRNMMETSNFTVSHDGLGHDRMQNIKQREFKEFQEAKRLDRKV